jgi:hypothetical protein
MLVLCFQIAAVKERARHHEFDHLDHLSVVQLCEPVFANGPYFSYERLKKQDLPLLKVFLLKSTRDRFEDCVEIIQARHLFHFNGRFLAGHSAGTQTLSLSAQPEEFLHVVLT